jgi:hypothetical protein
MNTFICSLFEEFPLAFYFQVDIISQSIIKINNLYNLFKMRFLTTRLPLILATSASLVAAQDATTTGSPATTTKCAAQK